MEDLKISDEEPVQPVYGGGPLPQALSSRQLGHTRFGSRHCKTGVNQAIDELAENKLIDREFSVKQCQLRGPTRSCFLVVFSPDRRLMASTHGDHNIYVTEVKTGSCVQTLKGHPRTPWCIAFHPSFSDIIASGCLGGQVRVWDLHCGSELWVTDGVIASLAFHPVERLLVIATFNELHFWDWSQSKPLVKIVTSNDRERVRYVKFDKVGHQLITGIANLTPLQSAAAAAAAREANEDLASDLLRARDADERRYNVILDRFERAFDRINRDLEWPETGARRVLDQPELIQAAVAGVARAEAAVAAGGGDHAGVGPAGDAPDQPIAQAPAASRLLSDIAAAADGGDTPPRPRLRYWREVSPRPRYMRYSLLLDRDELDRPRISDPDSPRLRSRGRDGPPRLRRVESFREYGDTSRRQELRERMLELRRLRDINREVTGRWANSPFRHSSSSVFNPVTPASASSSAETPDRGHRRTLDIVSAPERVTMDSEDAPLSSLDPGPSTSGGHGQRIPVWTGAGLSGHRPPQSRQSFMEEFLRSENRDRSLEDIHRMLNDDLTRDNTDRQETRDRQEVQRVTLTDSRDNNNLDHVGGDHDSLSLSPDNSDFMSRSYRALGSDTRAVLLRRRQARMLAERLMRRSERSERQRLMDNIIDDELSMPRRMSPPVSIPLLTPTQIADRLESSGGSVRSPARSPGRSPGRSSEPLDLPPLNLRPSPRPHRGRRSTADGPSTGMISERLTTLQSELSGSSPGVVNDNPFTSRPPSSASEVEIELASTAGSTVSSPVPRPVTARGRYSVDIQAEEAAAGRSSADTLGRSSVDSALRRSFSSDVNVDLPAGVLGDTPGDDDDMFASDSSSSRPNSRQNNIGAGSSDSRRLIERSISRSRQLLARRPSLSRLHEEEIPFERAASASQALAPVIQSPSASSVRTEPAEDIEIESDVPLDTFDTETGAVTGTLDIAPDEIPPADNDEDNAEEMPTVEPLELLQNNEATGDQEPAAGVNDDNITLDAAPAMIDDQDVGAEVEINTNETSSDQGSSTRQHELSRRTTRDMSLLSRHIDHMLRICRAPVSDPTLPRPRREMIRLQGIRRMLEDLQRQIRQLQAAAGDDGLDSVTPEPMRSIASGPSLRPYLRHQRQHRRTLSGGHSNIGGSVPGISSTSSRSTRLTRAHSQLVTQLRATVRAMELSPVVSESLGSSSVETSVSTVTTDQQEDSVSRSESTTPPIATSSPLPPSQPSSSSSADIESTARNDLRAMSQRLERLLRQRRELMERLGHEIQSEVDTIRESSQLPALVDSSSQSEEEEDSAPLSRDDERAVDPDQGAVGSGGSTSRDRPRLRRNTSSRIPVRRSAGVLLDYYDHDSYLRSRSSRGSSSAGAAGGESWRPLTTRERLDIRAGLRRETERERVRLARERDLSLRRLRYGELGTAGADRFPPLRELILRRLRGRGNNGNDEEEDLLPPSGTSQESRDRSRHREMLSWMVDQLTIDHETGEAEQLEAGAIPRTVRRERGDVERDWRAARYGAVGDGRGGRGGAGGGGDQEQGERAADRVRADNMFIRANERRLFRDYNFHHHPSNIALTHRIQTWDFAKGDIPDISNAEDNIVVKEAKIHNDASVDIAEDGSMLVTLVPSNLPMTTVVGLYSLRKENLGDCYATYSLESSAVSVSLSPTSRHLLVGLTSRTTRIISLSPMDRQLMAQVFRIKLPSNSNERGRFIHRRDINQVDYGHMSLNCIRWIPVPGQGIVFATNTGLLKILR